MFSGCLAISLFVDLIGRSVVRFVVRCFVFCVNASMVLFICTIMFFVFFFCRFVWFVCCYDLYTSTCCRTPRGGGVGPLHYDPMTFSLKVPRGTPRSRLTLAASLCLGFDTRILGTRCAPRTAACAVYCCYFVFAWHDAAGDTSHLRLCYIHYNCFTFCPEI